MTRRRRFTGICEWDGCTNTCSKRWCEQHRSDGYRLLRQEAHRRRMQNADWVERNRARNRDRQRQQRAAWGPLDRELASQQRRLSKYGVTIDWFHDQIARQDGRCAICRQVPTGQRPWHVDHDHATGQVRALLCSGCNTGIGHMRDNPQILRAAADYIERHSMRQAA